MWVEEGEWSWVEEGGSSFLLSKKLHYHKLQCS